MDQVGARRKRKKEGSDPKYSRKEENRTIFASHHHQTQSLSYEAVHTSKLYFKTSASFPHLSTK
jgi:hypothetical protein